MWRGIALLLALGACASASAQLAPLPMALCAGWRNEPVCELLQEDAQIRVLRCTFAPGVGHETHYHPPHFGYVLEGDSVMRITTAGGVVDRPVSAGSAFANDSEIQHAALNVGNETTRYLIVEKKYADTRAPEAIAPGLCAR
ncbi:MAG: cupin domain-containing protein [Hyphomonadaceae bacterium]|nr:cupin domain-containing protein [Hyphomonadaceae bacterium]